MLTAKIVLCISAFVFFLIARILVDYEFGVEILAFEYEREHMTPVRKMVIIISLVLGAISTIAFCVLHVMTLTIFTIGWILLFSAVCVSILFKGLGIRNDLVRGLFLFSFMILFMSLAIYSHNTI